MATPLIKVESLSKKFIITHETQERYTTLRDVIVDNVKKLRGNSKNKPIAAKEEFWALNDVSFEIQRGDRVGIIGRNGAGKSTLLKILSRITEPTAGRITIRGRVASLLEVGTGFHPELSGRENIFLNGAILGMSRIEIRRKFDEIVAFAEIEKFLDTPVKRYSSGMYVRLAFAVAAHLEPEILIVDEVLAVGDAQFQKKCLGKMEDVSRNEGRTVLFVSHNMSVIKSLCNSAILLSAGKVVGAGNASTIVNNYLDFSSSINSNRYSHKFGGKEFRINNVNINGNKDSIVKCGADFNIEIEFENFLQISEVEFFILIYNNEGVCVQSFFESDFDGNRAVGASLDSIKISLKNNLYPGKYFLSVGAFDKMKNFLDWVEHCESFEIEYLFENGQLFRDRLGLTIGKAIWRI